jgi:antitoxin HicB
MLTESEIDAQVDALLRRPYRMVIASDPEAGFVARAPELPGCLSDGPTEAEALASLRDAMAGWFELALERGIPIPEPAEAEGRGAETRYSGKFVLRVPRSVHRQLAERAEAEGVSLNQMALALLSQGLGAATART